MPQSQYVSTGITVTFDTLDAELIDVDHSGESVGIVKCPNQAGGYMVKLADNQLDAGSLPLVVGFDPDNAVVPALGTKATLTVAWPAGTSKWLQVEAILKKRNAINAKLGTRMVNSLEFELTGTPNWAYVD